MEQKNSYKSNPTNIVDELKNLQFRRDIKKEYRDLKDFYLDDEKKDKLKNMSRLPRFFFQSGYLILSIFEKLTPLRKLLVILGLVLMFLGSSIRIDNQNNSSNDTLLGGLLILFVLVLELKDKLLAVEELIAGRKIQKALMPEENPKLDGWDIFLYTSSANEVSGDLVDFLKIDDKRSVITIADVAGKGLSAALLTAKLQATVRAFADSSFNPAELTTKTNKIFHRDSLPNLFASMICLEISANTGEIKFANAGHLPPIILKDGNLMELEKGDAALGLFNSATYKNVSLSLQTNQIFFAYSDGITEAANEANQFFGKERLFNLLKGNDHLTSLELGRKTILTVERFRGEAKVSDDISLVILKKT